MEELHCQNEGKQRAFHGPMTAFQTWDMCALEVPGAEDATVGLPYCAQLNENHTGQVVVPPTILWCCIKPSKGHLALWTLGVECLKRQTYSNLP